MITVYFKNISDGKLARLPYLGHLLLINLILFGLMIAVGFAIGAGEHIIGGNLQQAQDMLRKWFTIPFSLIFVLSLIVYFFAVANITAKRLRDIGLPAWWVLLAIIVLELIVAYYISKQVSSTIDALFGLALILIPSNSFDSKK